MPLLPFIIKFSSLSKIQVATSKPTRKKRTELKKKAQRPNHKHRDCTQIVLPSYTKRKRIVKEVK